ncbi:MAG: hypothetical protein JNL66_22415 [Alphaproteobacteria bacterium]|nr:hypothetical protein [Alphaproteobacteria bacterium]
MPTTRMNVVGKVAVAVTVSVPLAAFALINGPVTVALYCAARKFVEKNMRMSSSRVAESKTRPPARPAASSA